MQFLQSTKPFPAQTSEFFLWWCRISAFGSRSCRQTSVASCERITGARIKPSFGIPARLKCGKAYWPERTRNRAKGEKKPSVMKTRDNKGRNIPLCLNRKPIYKYSFKIRIAGLTDQSWLIRIRAERCTPRTRCLPCYCHNLDIVWLL